MRVLEEWYGPQENWGLNGMSEETWLNHPTDSRLDLYNLEKYVHEEVDRDQYLNNPGIYMVVKSPHRINKKGYIFPFNNSKYAEIKTQGYNRIEVTTNPDYEIIFTPYVKPFPETSVYPKVPGSGYKYYKLYSYTHTTFESVSRILNWHTFPQIFID
jgi:hypothetical protein